MPTKKTIKRWLISILSLVFIVGFSLPAPLFIPSAKAASITVCPAGPPTCDYAHIQDAIDAASAGDVIEVAAGTYNEGITLKTGVSVQGAGTTNTFISGNQQVNTSKVLSQGVTDVDFSGFTIDASSAGVAYGIVTQTSSRISFHDLVVRDSNSDGIYIFTNAAPQIYDTQVSGNAAAGIRAINPGDATYRARIYQNTIGGNGTGLILENANSLDLYDNQINANTNHGVNATASSPVIYQNTLQGNGSNGILLLSNSNARLFENTIKGQNTAGTAQIYITDSSPEVISNELCSSGTNDRNGITIAGSGAVNPVLSGNNISYCNSGSADGIIVNNTNASPLIYGNTIDQMVDKGILLSAVNAPVIRDNSITNSVDGIKINDAGSRTNIWGNNISQNLDKGIDVISGSTTDVDSLVINNNVIANNADDGIYTQAPLTAIYNTIDQNGDNGFSAYSSLPVFLSNIVTNNTNHGLEAGVIGVPAGNNYNNVWNNTAGNWGTNYSQNINEISADPLYMKSIAKTPGYSLQYGSQAYPYGTSPFGGDSPSVDSGSPLHIPNDTNRPPSRGGQAGDMGAYGGPTVKSTTPTVVKIGSDAITAGQTYNSANTTPTVSVYTYAYTGSDEFRDAGNAIAIFENDTLLGRDDDLTYQNGGGNDKTSLGEIPLNLSEGSHDLDVAVINQLGVASEYFSFTYNLDTTVPTSKAGPLNSYYNTSTIHIPFTASADADTIFLYYRQGSSGSYSDIGPYSATASFIPFTPPAGDGHYQFYTIARNAAGTPETAPILPDAETTIDITAPTSSVNPLAQYQANDSFTVSWTGSDATSGIASYDIQFRNGGGAWTDWLGGTTATQSQFTGTEGHTYRFRSRARDRAGNVEAYGSYDTETTINPAGVDTIPPAAITDLDITDLNNGSIRLDWTAPGDSGNVGTAASYDFRFSDGYITNGNWADANAVPNPVKPKIAGTAQSMNSSVSANGLVGAWSDADNDGLTDYMESILYGSNPTNGDSDGDGYSDATENYYGYPLLDPTPAKVDQDYDGLIDEKEIYFYQTDPFNADTDGDSYSDAIEVWHNYSPLDPSPQSNWDEDGDGLTNYQETKMWHTNGNNSDTDGDGYNDYIEVHSYKYNPVNVFYYAVKTTDPAGNVSDLSNIANHIVIY